MFQTSGQYDPGMSGGPVLDQNGKCIGIVAHGMSEQEGVESVGFATSIACLGELEIDLEMDDGTTNHFNVQELTGRLIRRFGFQRGVMVASRSQLGLPA
jgi:hypothetical protein